MEHIWDFFTSHFSTWYLGLWAKMYWNLIWKISQIYPIRGISNINILFWYFFFTQFCVSLASLVVISLLLTEFSPLFDMHNLTGFSPENISSDFTVLYCQTEVSSLYRNFVLNLDITAANWDGKNMNKIQHKLSTVLCQFIFYVYL